MKKLKHKLITGIGAFFFTALSLTSCNIKRYKEKMIEDAVVSKLDFQDSYSSIEPSIGFDGNITLKTKHHPAKYNIGFNGKVNFEIDNQEIFKKFSSVGDKAIVEYNEVWQVTFEDKDKDGEKEIVDRKIWNHEFLDAYPPKEE